MEPFEVKLKVKRIRVPGHSCIRLLKAGTKTCFFYRDGRCRNRAMGFPDIVCYDYDKGINYIFVWQRVGK